MTDDVSRVSVYCGCGNPVRGDGQRYCLDCHAAYMRDWRKAHPLTDEQRHKDNCRSYAGVYFRRGKIERRPCERCGATAQMHHPDYAKPLQVEWLCRSCHLLLHRELAHRPPETGLAAR